ncbi:DUF262 domain-containing protein [Crocosphaera chwakensis]|uniref:DUF262 domain-containing protein n=1 Tax=Crocosphaera chwakensis CCY0110 TaxID=391612 RepID=A3IYW2_9CHRO|nr:DUF262 domain-containing protein [Crocosphaera chwakensis]EAZ88337.1 hypothetical protein CY0110_20940 [Crocosphaera chwakensis CCY0110]
MTAIKIDGAGYPIKDIFSDQFSFHIPNYQRPYAWKTDETERLLDDLIDAMGDDSSNISDIPPYFLGNIVLIKPDGNPKSEVVDGQQRLTTLTILLSVLSKLLPDNQQFLENLICQPENPLIGNPARPRLYLRQRDQDFFEKYIQISEGLEDIEEIAVQNLSDPQKNIINNTQILLKRISKKLPEESQKVRLTQFILQRCYLVAVSTPDFESAYRIFSVLNDRGLDLSVTDILKADLIGKISNDQSLENQYTKKWEDIEVKLGRDNFQELFSHIRMIYAKKRLSRKVIEEFREYVLVKHNPRDFIDNVLEPFSEAFDDIKKCDFIHEQRAKEINELLKWLHRIDHSEWIPPTILYITKHKNQPEKILTFLTHLERLAAGLMICRTNIHQRNKRYGDILQAIEDEADLYGVESPLQLSTSEQQEIMKLLKGNLYEMRKVNLYVLLRLDSLISDGFPNYDGYKVITIEHILPQNPPLDSEWNEWFTSQEEKDKYVHRLGNLVLLSRKKNSEAGNYEYQVKKDKYINNPTAIFALTIQAIKEKEWTPEIIEQRQRYLLAQLQNLWNLNLSTQ